MELGQKFIVFGKEKKNKVLRWSNLRLSFGFHGLVVVVLSVLQCLKSLVRKESWWKEQCELEMVGGVELDIKWGWFYGVIFLMFVPI